MNTAAKPVWSGAVVVTYVLVSAALLATRLTSVLHAESSAVVAACAFFIAGLSVFSGAREGGREGWVLAAQLSYLLIPWAFLTLSLVWVANCAYLTGLVLYVTFTVPSVVLGFALGTLVRARVHRFRRSVFVVAGLSIALAGAVYDLALHPQFFVLNHVFGGVLGPIYEDALYVRPGLFAFRVLTLLWALLLLIAAGSTVIPAVGNRVRRMLIAGLAICIGLLYAFAPQMGINTPDWYLQRSLGGRLDTEHFRIYFRPGTIGEADLQALADDHEYRFDWLERRLGVAPARRIRSYIYPTVTEKIRLTGAGLTDVTPVWLRRPQMHILRESYPETFGHELVHVFSREFGLPLIRASWFVGLVEGLAVALEPPDGRPAPEELVSVAAIRAAGTDVGLEPLLAKAVVDMLSPRSFWSTRGPVSYATAGAFVGYLVERYGVERVRDVYARGDFERTYGRPITELAREWEAHVRALPVVSLAADDLVMRRFTLPSLFEAECPHYQPDYARFYRRAMDRMAVGDTVGASRMVERSLRALPGFAPALTQWSMLRLARGDSRTVVERVSALPDSLLQPALRVYFGDALALEGDSTGATRQYEAALDDLPRHLRDARTVVLVRRLGGGSGAVAAALHGLARRDLENDGPSTQAFLIATALSAASRGDYADAAVVLASVQLTTAADVRASERRFMQRMIAAWTGVWSRRGGDLARSEAYLRQALAEALEVGDYAHAAEVRDQLEKTAWFGSSPDNLSQALFPHRRVTERRSGERHHFF